MTGRERIGALAVSFVAFILAAGVLSAQDRARGPAVDGRVLFVRSPQAASRLFLSFDAAAADVYWMRAIQHVAAERRLPAPRFEHLSTFLDLATTLDAKFNVAYRLGAILLAQAPPDGPGRPDQAIRLLEKGLAANPDRWQYAHDIGYVHYFETGRYDLAAEWFERAAALPGAPGWLAPLAASTRLRGGDRQGARSLLSALLEAEESYIRESARRGLAQIQALDDLDRLAELVARHREQRGRFPERLDDLVTSGALTVLPHDPTGRPYVYSSSDGRVDVSPDSGLLPLPRALRP